MLFNPMCFSSKSALLLSKYPVRKGWGEETIKNPADISAGYVQIFI